MKEEYKEPIYKNKKIYIILIILMVVAVISIGSYALLLWSSEENTEMTLRIGDFAEVIFPPLNQDDDPSDGITISGNQVTVSNMGPVFDYEKDGEVLEFSVTTLLPNNSIFVNSKLHITTITDNLKTEDFKVVVFYSTDKENYTYLSTIDFADASNDTDINLFSKLEVTKSAFFKLIFYIDGNNVNSNDIQGGSLSAYITADATPRSAIVNPNCTNATATFDYTKKSILISNTTATGAITCSLAYTPAPKTSFSDYIISKLDGDADGVVPAESTTGNGSTLEIVNSPLPTSGTSTDYRYRGINPANYVMFNDELWRVIGVFDSNTHNVKDANNESVNLVKLIRNDSIGGYVWDNAGSNGSNNYVNSDIYKLLNNAYYNTDSEDAEPLDATGQDYCYVYQSSLPGKCDFTKVGIQKEYKKMVEDNAVWYLGGNGSADTASNFYKYERTSTKVYSGNTPSVVAPIGLMYTSDYGYAAPSACDSTSTGSFANSNSTLGTTCTAKDWLMSNYVEWTITHRSSYSYYVFIVRNTGNLDNYHHANNGYATRPVLYLDSSVYYLSGTGTQTDPYIIAMD